MKSFSVRPTFSVRKELNLPGDKSIAHRAIILSAIACGNTVIENFPLNKDCLYTIEAVRQLGIKIKYNKEGRVEVCGKGLYGFKKSVKPIFAGDSGTTLRLISGVLAGQHFSAKLQAGKSLSKRPMLRVTEPLRMMGARINGIRNTEYGRREEYPPLTISGGDLQPIIYRLPVASAQVKSAILLAGLFAEGATGVIEPVKTRDHTERMLKLFKAGIKAKGNEIFIEGGRELTSPARLYLPADISSAAFFMVMAALLPDSRIKIKNVSLNPTRSGLIKALKKMGADIKVSKHQSAKASKFEPMGDIIVKSSRLKGITVKRKQAPALIDELPVLMVASCLARGKSVFEGVGELRVKETDRIRSMLGNLKRMGADIEVSGKGSSENIIIRGVKELTGAAVSSFGDHRTAMSMVVAGLKAKGSTRVDDISCIDKSFPEFLDTLRKLTSCHSEPEGSRHSEPEGSRHSEPEGRRI